MSTTDGCRDELLWLRDDIVDLEGRQGFLSGRSTVVILAAARSEGDEHTSDCMMLEAILKLVGSMRLGRARAWEKMG